MRHFLLVIMGMTGVSGIAQGADCLQPETLTRLDARYEEALRTGDTSFLQTLLAENFAWVHNHAVETESKEALLSRLKKQEDIPIARRSTDTVVRRLQDAAVISGFTTVEKPHEDNKTLRASRYHFMRTYVAVNDQCRLLSGQTMKVWSSDPAETP